MVEQTRVRSLNGREPSDGQLVLYWMQASQRAHFNPALEHAVLCANELRKPLVVAFGLMDDYPEANLRHYAFMLEGLREVRDALHERGIPMIIRRGSPPQVAIQLAKEACTVVCDRGYLRHQKLWRVKVAEHVRCRLLEVESDVVVPVDEASDHAEFAARTLRPKIQKAMAQYLVKLPQQRLRQANVDVGLESEIDLADVSAALDQLKLDRTVGASPLFSGGQEAGRMRLRRFIREKLSGYDERSNDPAEHGTSTLGAYLHFGQLSPVEIALAIEESSAPKQDRESYLEQLIVRRELAMNFVNFNPQYDSYDGLPEWSRQTLHEHRDDSRPYQYSLEQLESAQTHDRYWNAAQKEMLLSGYMHNYMRMYWGKKILEWKRSPREAFQETLYLNNKYFLCGRDPNAYANVAWLYGQHDRPWTQRPVFGTVRYMNSAGLERKFDMDAYVGKVERLEKGSEP